MTTRRCFLLDSTGAASAVACAAWRGAVANCLGVSAPASQPAALSRHPTPDSRHLAVPSAAQRAWQDLEVGMFLHCGPNTWQNREYDDRSTPLSAINPDIDTDQWVDTAVSLGAKYIVLVAKHVGGFCLWQTATTDYSIGHTSWRGGRGDVMADLSASCARRVDHVVLEEALASGERVREYRLEGLVGGAWTLLGTGTAIGHKRIHPVGPVTASAIRLDCRRTAGEPLVRRLAAYDTGSAPPATWEAPARVWADDAVGEWANGRCDVNLTPKLPAAAQYRVRFAPAGGDAVALTQVELVVGGASQPHLVRPAPGRRDVLLLTVPGLGQPIVLRARVRGAARGTLLLQRL